VQKYLTQHARIDAGESSQASATRRLACSASSWSNQAIWSGPCSAVAATSARAKKQACAAYALRELPNIEIVGEIGRA